MNFLPYSSFRNLPFRYNLLKHTVAISNALDSVTCGSICSIMPPISFAKAPRIQESKDIAKKYGIEDKNGHPAWFMEIYEERKIAYYGEHSSPKLHPSITHLSTDKPLSEETLGIVNKMAEMAKNE